MEWIPAPTEDLKEFFALTVRKILIDLAEFRLSMPGFQVDVPAGSVYKELVFPKVGVDFRTVVPTGHIGAFHPEVLTPDGLVARLAFTESQAGRSIVIPDYTRWSTYMVGVVDEIPFDLFTWYGDPDRTDKHQRTIPLLVPIVEDWFINRMSGRGETASVHGILLMYGTASPDARRLLKTEAAKVYNTVRAHGDLFAAAGIKSFLLEPPTYSFCTNEEGNGSIHEAQMQFSGLVKLH